VPTVFSVFYPVIALLFTGPGKIDLDKKKIENRINPTLAFFKNQRPQ
jgi:hypothetical protein